MPVIKNVSPDAKDVGKLIKYLILVTMLYSILYSGSSVVYGIATTIMYFISIVMYPIRILGFNAEPSLVSVPDIQDVQNVQDVQYENTEIVQNTETVHPTGLDHGTTIGKIIRALIGP